MLVILNLLNSISASLKENDSDSTDINDCLVFDPIDGLCEPQVCDNQLDTAWYQRFSGAETCQGQRNSSYKIIPKRVLS